MQLYHIETAEGQYCSYVPGIMVHKDTDFGNVPREFFNYVSYTFRGDISWTLPVKNETDSVSA
jgi:hypothetical protein